MIHVTPFALADQIPEVPEGLDYAWSGRPILPDDRIADWVVAQVRTVLDQQAAATTGRRPRHQEAVVVTATRTARHLTTWCSTRAGSRSRSCAPSPPPSAP